MEPLEDLKVRIRDLCKDREWQALRGASAEDLARFLGEKRKNLRGLAPLIAMCFLLAYGNPWVDILTPLLLACGILLLLIVLANYRLYSHLIQEAHLAAP